MVMPQAMAELCPQCGADVRASGARCKSCGFWLPAAPPPRSRPPMERPVPPKDESRKQTILVLAIGSVVVLGLLAAGTMVWLRQPSADDAPRPAVAALVAPTASAAPQRLEPSTLLAEARRQASAWHRDAVLISLNAGPLDARGVAPGGKVEISYAKPSGERLTGGADAGSERLLLSAQGGDLASRQERGAKGRITPEPNCLFEDAWAAAQRAGADVNAGLGLRYAWSEKHGRPIWEVVGAEGVQKRLDGVTCSILTR
jgi:hypothetical protein